AGMFAGIGQAVPKAFRYTSSKYNGLRFKYGSASFRERYIENGISKHLKEIGGDPNSPTERILLKNYGETRSALKNPSEKPSHFYRGSTFPLQFPRENTSIDDRLVDMFLHTGRKQGSRGIVQSFSSEWHVASRFAGNTGTIYKVPSEGNEFISTAQLINDHADRLIRDGRIQKGTVARAIDYYFSEDESEYFWLSGSSI
ncbi:hypothetical protein XS74_25425, partial [Salmonella enterica subsp. enterica]|nr:hypothetical protein [Salmonella enterica subsp. enterica]